MPLDLADALAVLASSTGRTDLAADTPLHALGVDSVALLDLLYEVEDRTGVDLVHDSTLARDLPATTLRELVDAVNSLAGGG